MTRLQQGFKFLCIIFFTCAAPVFAQTFSVFGNLGGNQVSALSNVIQAADGNYYGTTVYGGPTYTGTVFKITPAGAISTVYLFCSLANCVDGAQPFSGLTLGADGNLYGSTNFGGANGEGTVFKVTLSGTLTTLHSFDGTDGCTPQGGVMLANNGLFYGTTLGCGSTGWGTVFSISSAGTFRTLHNFTRSATDGGAPYTAPMQASDGNLYGVTLDGGGSGVVYKMTPAGSLATIHRFCLDDCTDGESPLGGLVEGTDGALYGTTATSANCQTCGTVFRITTTGALTTLHTFSVSDGATPLAALAVGNDGVMYGTTSQGGASTNCSGGCGTIYSMTTGGTFTSLYSFCVVSGCPDGDDPQAAPLYQATNGTFYDGTPYGGTGNVGVIFAFSEGYAPFVTPSPAAGTVGSRVTILGNSLSGATAVSFNGTPAVFSTSPSAIRATVPAGATTGIITVTLPGSTLTSKINFTVRP